MNELIWLVSGVLLSLLFDWIIRLWRQRESRQRRTKAELVLKKHGLTPQLYIASIGIEDAELIEALYTLPLTGYILLDANGKIVGKLCPSRDQPE